MLKGDQGIPMDAIKYINVIQKQRAFNNYAVGIYARVRTSYKAHMDSSSAQV